MKIRRPVIEAPGHTLEVRLPALDIEIDADPNRLVQVVSNLLANAAKYTPKSGAITLEAMLRDGEAVVEVSDNGIGMKAEEIEQLFDMFAQGQDAMDRAGGGMGIGLALSRSILQLHGGWLRAESAGPGKGSRLSFGVPALRQVPLQRPQASQVSVVADRIAGAVILVADDNQDAAWAVTQWLTIQGFETLKADDGASALALAESHRPRVMLVDIGMPELSGHEVARRIRTRPWGRNVLLIAITGWGHEHDVRASMEAGFDLHMTKPVDMPRLRDVIETYLSSGAGTGT